tara:strand:- start:18317 stop:22597 length:4281 start_codon:yes stop_codon:yes gene_type:complete
VLILLQTPAAAWFVEPILAAQTGMDVQTGSVRVSPFGTVVITDARLSAPSIPGVAGQVLEVDRVVARIDWTATLAGSPGLKALRMTGPVLRLSQDSETGVLNAAAFKMLGGGGGGSLPRVSIQRGTIELAEHTGEQYTPLRRWSVIGDMDPADADGVSAFSFAAIPAEAAAGASPTGSLGLTGTIGPDGVEARLDGLTLEDWPASIVPSRLRVIYARLDLTGRLLPTRFVIDRDGRVTVRMTLDGVDLNLPFNEDYSLEGEGELLRMRQTRGTIEFGTDGLGADLTGLIDELRYDVDLRYAGLTADAPFSTELTTRFRMDSAFRPRRFLPEQAVEKLEMFENPTADVDATVRVTRATRGAPVEVSGRATVSNGRASYGKFRYPFSDLSGEVAFTQDSLVIERITARGPTGATLEADGRFDGLDDQSTVVINLKVRGVPVDRYLNEALNNDRRKLVEALFNPDRYQELLDDGLIRTPDGRGGRDAPVFSFGGAADVDLVLRRDPARPADDRWTRDTVVRLDRAGLVPEHFPLPIVARGIELRITDDTLALTGGRYEGLTGGQANVEAALDQTATPPGGDTLPVVSITASGIPVDERLLAAIPGYRSTPDPDQPVSLRSILDNLRVAGSVECRAVIGPRSDGRLGYDVEANLYNATARPNAAAPGMVATTDEPDPLVLAGMSGTVYVTERIIVVDLSGDLQSPSRPLAPTPITLLTQLTLPQQRGGLGDVARVGGLLPIEYGPPVPGPTLYANARADGLDLAMPLEHAAAVFSPELAERLAALRQSHRPDGVVALRAELDGIVGGHTETVLEVERISSLALDHLGTRHRIGQSRGSMELTLGIAPRARFSGFRVPINAGGIDSGELSLDGSMPLIPPGRTRWSGDAGTLRAGLRGGRIESPATAQIVGAFGGPGPAAWLRDRRVEGGFDLDLTLTPRLDARVARAAGDAYALPAMSAVGTLRPTALALDLPEARIEFTSVTGRVLFEGLGGRVDSINAQAPGLSVAIDGPWSFEPGRGAGLDLALDVGGDRLNDSVRTLLPAVLLGVMDRFAVSVDGPLTAENLRINASGLGTPESTLTVRGEAQVSRTSAVVGVAITDLAGRIGFEAEVTPQGAGYSVELAADRMRAGRLRVEQARATILADRTRPGIVLVPEINGRLHGGRIAGSAQARTHGSETRYWVDLHASDVRAAPVFDDLLLPPEGLTGPPLPGEDTVRSAWAVTDDYTRGLLDADVSITGVGGQADKTAGRGVVRVAGGAVIALPGLINLIEVSNLRAPVGAQLDLAEGVFYIDGPVLAFERLSASSNSVEILGHGTMNWVTQDLDLRFRSRSIRPVPFFSSLLEQVRDELITTKVTGRPGNLDFSTENFGATRRLIRALIGEPETEQERVMSAVEQASRASKNRGPVRESPAVLPTAGDPDEPWPAIDE